MKKLVLATITLALLASAPALSAREQMSPEAWNDHVKKHGNYLIQFAEDCSAEEQLVIIEHVGGKIKHRFKTVKGVAAHLTDWEAGLLKRNSRIRSLVPNRPVYAIGKSEVKKGGPKVAASQVLPAGVARIGADQEWATITGVGVGVAVVDTGIDMTHPDLADNVASECYDAYSNGCQDNDGHGTHVAGIIGAIDNNIDVVGVAPQATLYNVKVLDSNGSGSDATVIVGLEWIAANAASTTPHIKVVNMSLGRERGGDESDNTPMHSAITSLVNKGITVVVAAGNDPTSDVSQQIPAAYTEVIAVASTTAEDGSNSCRAYPGYIQADTASVFTTDGEGVTISAPGETREDIKNSCRADSVGILSTKLGGGTTPMSGTSMAAPHVAGAVALLLGKNNSLSPGTIKPIIAGYPDPAAPDAPYDSPTGSYTDDGFKEGILYVPAILDAIATN